MPQRGAALPEGAQVEIAISPPQITSKFQAELDRWERAANAARPNIGSLK